MPQISLKHGLAALIVCLTLLGCSDPKNQIFDPETGKHITGWLPAQHAAYATSGTTTMGNAIPSTAVCTECHGADLSGGISNVSCMACHMGGPTSVHPLTWEPIYLTHGPSASVNGTTPCSNQYCHGANLGGVAGSGPACSTCHTWPFTPGSVSCNACHRIPPDGSRYPNIAGKHAKHATSSTLSCNICHALASSYTYTHSNGSVNVAIQNNPGAYRPLSGGTPTFNAAAGTCSNINCHGGPRTQSAAQANAGGGNPATAQSTLVATPSWFAGSLIVNTQCTSCHVFGNVEYNSYSTGRHYLHVWDPNNGPSPKLFCTACHDTAKLAVNHFTSLGTTTMSPASATILNSVNYSGGGCNPSCHGGETW